MSNPTEQRIKDVIASNDIVLFMKGVPAAPQCGFSGAVVQILSGLGVPFAASTCWPIRRSVMVSRRSRTGRRFRNFTSRASFSAAATSSARCSKPVSSPRC